MESRAKSLMREHLEQACGHELAEKELLFRNGRATVSSVQGFRSQFELSRPEEWGAVETAIFVAHSRARTLFGNSDNDIQVNIYRDFIALRNCRKGDKTFADTKADEMAKLRRVAFDGRKYIPRVDVKLVASRHTIREVVAEDTPPGMGQTDKDQFVTLVYDRARTLFAMCIYAPLNMGCLMALIDKGHSDETPFLRDDDICHHTCDRKYERLVEWQGTFRAAEFMFKGGHQDLHHKVVVPLHYYPKTEDEDSILQDDQSTGGSTPERPTSLTIKEKSCCGSGAFSEVFRVTIDPDQHRLADDRTTPFALKEYRDRPKRRGQAFKRELEILDELQKYRHQHIVTHLATWTQDDKYFMLFPYATCNLRQYMAHWEFGPPQRGPTVWLLEQFRGLADALRVIHNLSDTTILRAQAQLTVPATRNIAWHHDLKPDNFLFFSTQDSPQLNRKAGEGIISIADFGSGKVHTFRPSPTGSINTRSPNGTPTYESPETRVASSRPSDVWSLGCVFLELLVWALFDYEAVKDFSIRRQGRRNLRDSTGIEDNAFWQEPEQGGAELRQAVEDQMDILKDEIDRKRKIPFSEVLDLIKKMLHINPQQRVDAVHVWNALDRIYNQADGPFWTMDEDDQETLLLRLSTHIPAYLPPCSQPFEPLSKLDSISPLKFFSPLKRRRTDGGNSSLSRRSDVS